jgi:tRNA-2-methylthio-N6-dimethylallyladenosine synthase
MTYHIITFGCAANTADSERIAATYESRGYKKTESLEIADEVIINTCMIRQMAEDRVYGLENKLRIAKKKGKKVRVILTGCMVGMAIRDTTKKLLRTLKARLPAIDDFLPIEEVGYETIPQRSDSSHALVPISNGCNNFCTYCVVPFSRGREISRPYDEIIRECDELANQGYDHVTLIGQNVNSYGADIIKNDKSNIKSKTVNNKKITYVKHLGRLRIPTLFPQLLSDIASMKQFKTIDFISSNPWDFSDDLIDTIAKHTNISRDIHLPIQSGDNEILKKMNRWYTKEQYLMLISRLKTQIPKLRISTDIIVGFCEETEDQFQNTVDVCKNVGFFKAYISMYSDRPMTAAHASMKDTIPLKEKKRRWKILEDMINIPNLQRKTR